MIPQKRIENSNASLFMVWNGLDFTFPLAGCYKWSITGWKAVKMAESINQQSSCCSAILRSGERSERFTRCSKRRATVLNSISEKAVHCSPGGCTQKAYKTTWELCQRDPKGTIKKSADPGLGQGRGGAWDHRRCGPPPSSLSKVKPISQPASCPKATSRKYSWHASSSS